MVWIAGALASSTLNPPPLPSGTGRTRIEVHVRLIRGGEASKQVMATRDPQRVRTIVDKLPDGRDVTLVVFDFE